MYTSLLPSITLAHNEHAWDISTHACHCCHGKHYNDLHSV